MPIVYAFEKEISFVRKKKTDGIGLVFQLLKLPVANFEAIVTSYEMDDFLLMHLKDGQLFDKKEINIDEATQAIGYYIVEIWENPEISKYIVWATSDDPEIYSKFKLIYTEVKAYDAKYKC